MKLPDFIRLAGNEPALGFLLIGGFAVAVHGYTRHTFDVDFLIRRSELAAWKAKLFGAGLMLFAERSAFAQFSQGEGQDGLDLMLVDDRTFERMKATAVSADFDGVTCRVVNLDNLLILKLHVLRQALPHRTGKDAGDVEELLRRNRVDLESDHYRMLFLTYGDQNLYDTFRRLLRHS